MNSNSHRRSIRMIAVASIAVLTLSGCSSGKSNELLPAGVKGFNHTSAAINHFSVDGAGGPNISPYGGGGSESCCGMLPRKWSPGMKALVVWEKDPDTYAYAKWPEPMYSEGWNKRMKAHRAMYTQHTAYADIPQYEKNVCAIQVHFLPCDQVRVSTTCYAPWHPNYPDKEYFSTEETTLCPKP